MVQPLRNSLKQELRDQSYWNGSSSCPNKNGRRSGRGGEKRVGVSLEEFDMSLLVASFWKKKLKVPVTEHELFPFKLPLVEEMRGCSWRWDRQHCVVWCSGTVNAAFIIPRLCSVPQLICTIAKSHSVYNHLLYWSLLLDCCLQLFYLIFDF